ncbi:helix-turn-helix domain-containing protein [Clostridium sp. OS1-26]|uniref:helix-turn-helix domain-containing protein n=1 Tax=Clostridium sp. OS1-26 TaxID=3070681 RepID=UPI0027E0139F|nr:helix-turn-helix domain-containing protein [Clostridium sp. OS1-26]WML33734.1 helix-turn-helix domain-containing protein [Clostridium sp. OS1-26]
MLPITRYAIKSLQLRKWIKFIWYLETEADVTVKHKLLTTDSIDIILNLSDKIEYQIGSDIYKTSDFHFNALRDRYGYINQKGKLKVFGISFYPFGLYPFLQIPISEFNNQVIDLKVTAKELTKKLEASINTLSPVYDTVLSLEKSLESMLDNSLGEVKMFNLIQIFALESKYCSIKSFCHDNNLNAKTLERACLKYTGYTPKALQRIGRFQTASNKLICKKAEDTIASVAYENDYFDQAHFTREFQEFTGVTPSKFLKEHITIKENTKYIYR